MNGHVTNALIMVIGVLLGLVQLLFGLVLKAHKDRDDERLQELKEHHKEEWEDVRGEIVRLRNRVHELTSTVGKVDQWQRFHDEDKKP